MRPTEILMQEHRVIEQVLACLAKMAQETMEKSAIPLDAARDAVEFLRNFADRCHHGKEEGRLFPAMERAGLPSFAGPTAVMRQEHELGRDLVRRMAAALEASERGEAGAPAAFATAARSFVHLLRDHIAKEDQVLFPMADQLLSETVQQEVLAGFAQTETDDLGEGVHENFLEVARRLAERYGVTPAEIAAGAGKCSCSH